MGLSCARAAAERLLEDEGLARSMGESGRAYYSNNYAWPVIEGKYLDMFERLTAEPVRRSMEPLPGFFARRQRTLPPAADVLNQLPAGPARLSRMGRSS